MDYKVEDLLKIPFLKNASVLTGKGGMKRSLNWYQELRADGSGADTVVSTNENDILILADELSEWPEDRILRVMRDAADCGAGCVVMFSGDRDYRISRESLQIAEKANLPVIVVGERRLPVEILSREIAMILLQNSRSSSYLEEVFLAQTGEKELSKSDLQVIQQCSGYDFGVEHQAVCIGFEGRQMSADLHGLKAEEIGRIRDFCVDWLSNRTGPTVAGVTEQAFALFLPVSSSVIETEEQMEEMVRKLEQHLPAIRFQAGMGTPQMGLEKWKHSLREAKQALRAMRIFQWEGVRTIWRTQPAGPAPGHPRSEAAVPFEESDHPAALFRRDAGRGRRRAGAYTGDVFPLWQESQSDRGKDVSSSKYTESASAEDRKALRCGSVGSRTVS